MRVAVIGGGVNGLCCAWILAQQGHSVTLYERGRLVSATSCSSSKLLHGGLRYLENGEFRLVKEALRERDNWLKRVPQLTRPLRLLMPIYQSARRPLWQVGLGLFFYDFLAGKSSLPKSNRLPSEKIKAQYPMLKTDSLKGGFEFSDGQMDDYELGLWIAREATKAGVKIHEHQNVHSITTSGKLVTNQGELIYDRIINAAGPWAIDLLHRSNLDTDYRLDLVRGSHLVLSNPCEKAYLLEVPGERRIVFVLPWKGQTLLGTTECRQGLDEEIVCSDKEKSYLLSVFSYYFPAIKPVIASTIAGIRPLLYSAKDPNKATREYTLVREERLLTVLGGKWTTSLALAHQVARKII